MALATIIRLEFAYPGVGVLAGDSLQYLSVDKSNFGVFLDSSPDRWGRVLLRRRDAALARLEKRAPNNLTELDFLLGVFDGNRMGGLRSGTSNVSGNNSKIAAFVL